MTWSIVDALRGAHVAVPPLLALVAAVPQSSQAPPAPTVKEVRITRQGDLSVVTIAADGALPVPRIGQLDSPPRVFLDFEGVNAGTTGSPGDESSAVLRVRVALYSKEPRVTRVVLDLSQKHPIRTEAEEREDGRFKVVVGSAAPAADTRQVTVPLADPAGERPRSAVPELPPVTVPLTANRPAMTEPPGRPEEVPPPRTPDSPVRTAPPAPIMFPERPPVQLPPRDVGRYREQAGAALTRFRKLQPLLAAIDKQDPKPPEGLTAAREEFSAVLRTLTSLKPPDSMRATHDMLVRSASFALMAATLRDDAGNRAEPEKLRNAASAAAGAILLLERVCADVGCDAASTAR